jgi:GT2 family glycosyltransferase
MYPPTARTNVSIVSYRTPHADLDALCRLLAQDPSVAAWVIVDNAAVEVPDEALMLKAMVEQYRGLYLPAPCNLGFGRAHNLAVAALAGTAAEFHLVLNPDIVFDTSVLPELTRVLDARQDIALVMPRVFYPDGSDQRLCKLLPTPFDLALRRFVPRLLEPLVRHAMSRYELGAMDLSLAAEVPFLSGCFMFLRRSAFERAGGFDDRYFLYMEDVDLCRRIAAIGRLLYWPCVSVIHTHARGSHRHGKLMRLHLRSAWTYFNRWGWFFDSARRQSNRRTLATYPRTTQTPTPREAARAATGIRS